MLTADSVRTSLDFGALFGAHVAKLKRRADGAATGLCPFHEDDHPSLSINLATGLFYCFSCGAKGDVFSFYQRMKGVDFSAAVRDLGQLAGLAEDAPMRQLVVARFEYRDAASNLLYFKERLEPGRDGRKKEFRFFHGSRQPGRGCDAVWYRLPEVLRAKAVLIVEGEAKADLLASWGLRATCLDSGAGSKLTEEMVLQLAGKRIVILPDNDAPGRRYAQRLAGSLVGKVEVLKVLELPGLPEKGDILDWTRESERRSPESD